MNIQQDIEGLLENVNGYIDRLIQIAQDKYKNNIDIRDETFNSAEDIRTIKRFTSNSRRAWGSLLTPIVKAMRVKGRFKPEFCKEVPRLVLFDGQGLGHKTAMSSMPTNVIEYFRKSDGIVIVDDARHPILENVKMAIRPAIEYGYSEKVCFAFTHMDLRAGDDFGNFSDKRHHIWVALEAYISDMRRQNKVVLSETEATHLKEGIRNYRTAWGNKIGYSTKKEEAVHWSKVRALTRKLGYFGEDNYQ